MATIDTNDSAMPAGPGEGALTPVARGISGVPALPWNYGIALRPEILSSKANPAELLYALRRRWPLAVGLGVLVGGLLATLVWILVPIRQEVATMLRVLRAPMTLTDTPAGMNNNVDFDLFKRTQAALIKGHLVIQATLRKTDIARLPLVQQQKDPIGWLTGELLVDYPGDAEILRIAMKGEKPEQLMKIVNGVKDSYMDEIVNAEQQDRMRNKQVLEKKVRDQQEEIARRAEALHRQLNAPDRGEAASMTKKITIQRLDDRMIKCAKLDGEISDLKMKMALIKTHDAAASKVKVSPRQIEQALRQDEDIVGLKRGLEATERQLKKLAAVSADPKAPSIQRLREQISEMRDELENKIVERRAELEEEMTQNDGKAYTLEILEAELKAKVQNLAELKAEIEKASKEVTDIEEFTTKMNAEKDELDQLRGITASMARDEKLWDLNMDAQKRIIPVEEASVQSTTSDAVRKYVGVGFAAVLGFGLMLFGVAYIEFQSRRLNSPRDVNEGLGIRVMGDLPPLTGRAWRRIAAGKDHAGSLQALLAESIDNIRTTLIHTSSVESPRVVMITSAEPQEGKTTVATQLAASLARSGRRTLLIDSDLRSPASHRVFDLPNEPGLCELLRDEAVPDAVIYPTQADNLWLIPAGRCDLRSVQALANEKIGSLLDGLRSQFEFIIIDAGPVLTVADSLLVGQHVDAAILAVLRNVSKVPKVYEACERLKSVGITVLGSVVNGVNCNVHRGIDLHLSETG